MTTGSLRDQDANARYRDAKYRVSTRQIGKLMVNIYDTRELMGAEAAQMVCEKINALLAGQEFVNIIFAAAPSQNEFLAALCNNTAVNWKRVNAFHMDEYTGLPKDAPQAFGSFLKRKIFGRLPFYSVNLLDGGAADPEAECKRYAGLLRRFPPDIVCMGIGENGHIAFNDPHVADFNDPATVKMVTLDQTCRQQQVNDGCFVSLNHVPTQALTLTVPALMAGSYIYCIVPGEQKANAVYNTLNKDIIAEYPSTILRTHPHAILFLDKNSAALL
jgi:glucosamine-6-phosphate deaminase